MRREFEMTKKQLDRMVDACRPVPYIIVGGMAPRSPEERANDAWDLLGREMGFVGATARPVPGKGDRFFTAEVEEEEP